MKWCWPLILDHLLYFDALAKPRPRMDESARPMIVLPCQDVCNHTQFTLSVKQSVARHPVHPHWNVSSENSHYLKTHVPFGQLLVCMWVLLFFIHISVNFRKESLSQGIRCFFYLSFVWSVYNHHRSYLCGKSFFFFTSDILLETFPAKMRDVEFDGNRSIHGVTVIQ